MSHVSYDTVVVYETTTGYDNWAASLNESEYYVLSIMLTYNISPLVRSLLLIYHIRQRTPWYQIDTETHSLLRSGSQKQENIPNYTHKHSIPLTQSLTHTQIYNETDTNTQSQRQTHRMTVSVCEYECLFDCFSESVSVCVWYSICLCLVEKPLWWIVYSQHLIQWSNS